MVTNYLGVLALLFFLWFSICFLVCSIRLDFLEGRANGFS